MIFFKALPLCILLLVLDAVPVQSANAVSRVLNSVHRRAAKHTKSFARDLRIAFGAVLVSQDSPSALTRQRVVYCKSGGTGAAADGAGLGTNATGTSPSVTSSTRGSSTRTTSGASPTGSAVSTPWKLNETIAGDNFFDSWTFWTDADPTHGIVDYIGEDDARSAGLLEVNSAGNAVMRVETTGTVSNLRKSVRIHSKSTWNGALFLMDSIHMPTGCGTWPAFWTNGPNWPEGGEIDIVEGVNDYTNNQATIHTNPGCTIPSSSSSKLGITGSIVGGTNCAAAETGNQGCGVRSPSDVSFGAAFNGNGGGVYAMQWDENGVAIYFWARDDIPSDVTAETPLPSSWGQPLAFWPASGCDPFKFFFDNIMIFDTTLCGDWAGTAWTGSGIPGQEQSCAARTGFSDCESFVRANGASFQEAYWEVSYVKVFTKS